MRYKLLLSYRGTRYHGWQQQPVLKTYKGERPPPGAGIPTIQETLAAHIGRVVGHPVVVVGSSRTDAGVHAKGQIAHFDTSAIQIAPEGLRRAVNHQLPDDILIREIEPVPDSFDAITAAVSKRYQYFIWNALNRNPFVPDLCWHRWQTLDIPAMRAAAAQFLGEHDFASFSRPDHTRYTTIRAVTDCRVSFRGPMLVIGVEGDGFLWNMVRIIAGTLVEVGLGQYAPDDIGKMIAAKDRRAAGSTAPPVGLFLQWVKVRFET
jgi:tRNA pseudouridine38-40 synthase